QHWQFIHVKKRFFLV
ncbi:unnamed protein product, partial [Allacma fusca]